MRDAEKCLRAHKSRGTVMRTTGVALPSLSRRSSVTFAKYCHRNTYIKTNCQPYSAPNYGSGSGFAREKDGFKKRQVQSFS